MFKCRCEILINYQEQIMELFDRICALGFDKTIESSIVSVFRQLLRSSLATVIVPKIQNPNFESIRFENWPKLIKFDQFETNGFKTTEKEQKLAAIFIKKLSSTLYSLEESIENDANLSMNSLKSKLKLLMIIEGIEMHIPFNRDSVYNQDETKQANVDDSVNPFVLTNSSNSIVNRRKIVEVCSKILTIIIQKNDIKMDNENNEIIECVLDIYSWILCAPKFKLNAKPNSIISLDRRFKLSIFHYFNLENQDKIIKERLLELISKNQASNGSIESMIVIEDLLKICTIPIYKNIKKKMYLIFKNVFATHSSVLWQFKDLIKSYSEQMAEDHSSNSFEILPLLASPHPRMENFWAYLCEIYPSFLKISIPEDIAEFSNILVGFELFDQSIANKIVLRRTLDWTIVKNFENLRKIDEPAVTLDEFEMINEEIETKNRQNNQAYRSLINQIIQTIQNDVVHWRFCYLGLRFLNSLIQKDIEIETELVEFYLQCLIHDLQAIRSTAHFGFCKIIFKFLKANEIIMNWDEFDFNLLSDLDNEQIFNQIKYIDDASNGFYRIAYRITTIDCCSPNNLHAIIGRKFSDPNFLGKLFRLNSMESQNKLSEKNILIWGLYFTVFRLQSFDQILVEIKKLLEKKEIHFDKYAIEVLIGSILASQVFDRQTWQKFLDYLMPIFKLNSTNFLSESENSWRELFETMFANFDLRRFIWFYQFLKENLDEMMPFYKTFYLKIFIKIFENNWKYRSVSEEISNYVLKQISSSFQNERIAFGRLLNFVFIDDIRLRSLELTLANHQKQSPLFDDILSYINRFLEEKLSFIAINQHCDNDDEIMIEKKTKIFDPNTQNGLELLNALETICEWIQSSRDFSKSKSFLAILPWLFFIQTKHFVNEKINASIDNIAKRIYSDNDLDRIVAIVEKIGNNWNWFTRMKCVNFIMKFTHSNSFILKQYPNRLNSIVAITTDLLSDQIVEVRLAAHSALIEIISQRLLESNRCKMIENFKQKTLDSNVKTRHAGILGLSSWVSVYGEEIPEFLPEILTLLAHHSSSSDIASQEAMKTLRNFKKSNADSWEYNRKKFTAEQFEILNDSIVSNSYFA
ncbi:Proteasome activator complex subunit 4B [Sarcoptes scabiei]|uniref:Proteasome activator complex subunit 4B n=1 Tax=Sarcoptes scabiei TaxID=52283 RepID=A0A834R2F3_SARSC|nr:Proteasome activator complex subunit 4B [Sarcoptes scabiei]